MCGAIRRLKLPATYFSGQEKPFGVRGLSCRARTTKIKPAKTLGQPGPGKKACPQAGLGKWVWGQEGLSPQRPALGLSVSSCPQPSLNSQDQMLTVLEDLMDVGQDLKSVFQKMITTPTSLLHFRSMFLQPSSTISKRQRSFFLQMKTLVFALKPKITPFHAHPVLCPCGLHQSHQ